MKLNFPIIKINNTFSTIIHKALKYMIFFKKKQVTVVESHKEI